MLSKQSRLNALRNLVAEKFPQQAIKPKDRMLTGCGFIDQNYGGLQKGALTEICGSSGAGYLLLTALLATAANNGFFLGLIDGSNSFEPSDWPDNQLCRILWVRCTTTDTALKATDLLLRDGNLPILVLDLQLLPKPQLQRIPTSTWHRFQRLIEHTTTILTILTPQPLVRGVSTRIAIRKTWNLHAMELERSALQNVSV